MASDWRWPLPAELLDHVLEKLPLRSLKLASLVSREWRERSVPLLFLRYSPGSFRDDDTAILGPDLAPSVLLENIKMVKLDTSREEGDLDSVRSHSKVLVARM